MVKNSGQLSVTTRFSVYLDKNTELSYFSANKTTSVRNKIKDHVLKPTVFTGKCTR